MRFGEKKTNIITNNKKNMAAHLIQNSVEKSVSSLYIRDFPDSPAFELLNPF